MYTKVYSFGLLLCYMGVIAVDLLKKK